MYLYTFRDDVASTLSSHMQMRPAIYTRSVNGELFNFNREDIALDGSPVRGIRDRSVAYLILVNTSREPTEQPRRILGKQ